MHLLCFNLRTSERDLKSHAMRSKLLNLHLVLSILNSHMALFVSPSTIIHSSTNNDATTFIQAVNQYLCLCLSRNAVSPVPQVFEICVEIFWRVLSGMRTKLKVRPIILLLLNSHLHVEYFSERDRSAFTRDFYPNPGDEDINCEAESHYPWDDAAPL